MRVAARATVLAVFLAVSVTACSASSTDQADTPAAEQARELGVLAPVAVSAEMTVPRGDLWRPAQGVFVCPDTVCVRGEQGKRLEAVSGEPRTGQYRVRLDGCVRFANDDAGRRVSVSYDYRPRRVAVLPAEAGSEYADALPMLLETLTEQLQSRGFVFALSDDVADALVRTREDAGVATDIVTALARRLDAAYVLLPGVGATENEVLAGFQSHVWVSGSGRSAYGTATPVRREYMDAAVGMTVFDGANGSIVFERTAASTKRVRFRRFGPARRDMIRELTERLVREWRGSGAS